MGLIGNKGIGRRRVRRNSTGFCRLRWDLESLGEEYVRLTWHARAIGEGGARTLINGLVYIAMLGYLLVHSVRPPKGRSARLTIVWIRKNEKVSWSVWRKVCRRGKVRRESKNECLKSLHKLDKLSHDVFPPCCIYLVTGMERQMIADIISQCFIIHGQQKLCLLNKNKLHRINNLFVSETFLYPVFPQQSSIYEAYYFPFKWISLNASKVCPNIGM